MQYKDAEYRINIVPLRGHYHYLQEHFLNLPG